MADDCLSLAGCLKADLSQVFICLWQLLSSWFHQDHRFPLGDWVEVMKAGYSDATRKAGSVMQCFV